MARNALLLALTALALGAFAAAAGAASLKPLPNLNGVRCRQVVNSDELMGYSCGRASDPRSYVVTIEVAQRSPYGQRPDDVRSGNWVRTTRTQVVLESPAAWLSLPAHVEREGLACISTAGECSATLGLLGMAAAVGRPGLRVR